MCWLVAERLVELLALGPTRPPLANRMPPPCYTSDLAIQHRRLPSPSQPASFWCKKRPIWCTFASARAARGRASQG